MADPDVEQLKAENQRLSGLWSNAVDSERKLEAQRDELAAALHNAKCIGPHRQSNADFYCWMQAERKDWCQRCLALASFSSVTPEEVKADG